MTSKLLLSTATCALSLHGLSALAANEVHAAAHGLQTINAGQGMTLRQALPQTLANTQTAQTNEEGGNLQVTTTHFEVGQTVEITYNNLPAKATISVYKDQARIPLKEQLTLTEKAEKGVFTLGDQLEAGDYTVRCTNAKGEDITPPILFSVSAQAWTKGPKDIFVMSDIHVMSPELLIKEGSAFEKYLAGDRKLLAESKDIFYTMIDTILAQKPELVLIPGDLTKDGELLSHQLVAEQLKRLKQAGIQTLVVPGNHDVNNPHAYVFDGDQTRYAETVSREKFAEIYSEFGYGKDAKRDPQSLSYAVEALPDVVVVGIDACRYEDNTFVSQGADKDVCVTSGRIKPETLQWISQQAQEAREKGKQVLAVMHHNLVEHFNGQATIASPYVVENAAEVRKVLMEAGIRTVFTGHFHIQDIAKDYNETKTDSIYDISTGSTVTYPCPFRQVRLNEDNTVMELRGKLLKSVKLNGQLEANFGHYAQEKLVSGLEPMVGGLISDYWDTIQKVVSDATGSLGDLGAAIKFPETPEELTAMLMECIGEDAIKAYLTFSESNEDKKASEVLQKRIVTDGINKLVDKLVGRILGVVAKPIVHEKVDPILNTVLGSLLGNITNNGTDKANVTNDLDLSIDMPRKVVSQIADVANATEAMQVTPTLTDGPIRILLPELAQSARLCIYDLNGRILYTTEVPAGAPSVLPYRFQQKGVYLVKLIGQGNAVKVIVE